jgi:thiamine pyrophosphokinase
VKRKSCLVFLTVARVSSDISKEDILICADSGVLPLLQEGLIPHFIVGDMDSTEKGIFENLRSRGSKIEEYPKDKDLSDGELAVRKALELNPSSIVLFGGRSGRADHVLSSYQLLSLIPSTIPSWLCLDDDRIILLKGGNEIEVSTSRRIISILPANGVPLVTIRGLKWELDREEIPIGSTLGIHNENLGRPFKVMIECGDIYLIMTNDDIN